MSRLLEDAGRYFPEVGAAGPLFLRKLEVAERVHGLAVDAHLEVEVGAEAVAGAADVADHLALSDRGADPTAIDDWWP